MSAQGYRARPSRAMQRVEPGKQLRELLLRYLIIIPAALATLLPVYSAFVGALTEYEDLGKGMTLPLDWAWHNFIDVWSRMPLFEHLTATFIYAAGSALICSVIATVAGYALSRFKFGTRKFWLYVLLVCQVIPLIVIVLPLFRLVSALGLYDTYPSIVVPLAALSLPFPIMLMKSYFDTVPMEMEEAARVDGCSRFGALVRVVVPVATPGIFTVTTLVFFQSWHTFTLPLILSSSPDKTPVTVGIFRLLADGYQPWQYMMAASLIAVVPPLIVYFIAQRQFVAGLTSGAVK
jgi:multiple sugar transport system permease protein